MSNVKIYKKNLMKKVGAVTLSMIMGTSFFAFTGCNNKHDSDKVIYKVKKTEQEKYYDILYSSHYNNNESDIIENVNKYKEYDHFLNLDNDIEYIYPIDSINYTTSENKDLSKECNNVKPEFFINNSFFIIPDDMKWFKKYLNNPDSYTNDKLLNGDIKLIEYRGDSEQKYLYQESQVTVMKDISDKDEKGHTFSLKKGDYFKNIVLYKTNDYTDMEVIAYGKDGKGAKFLSDDNSNYNDIFDVYIPIHYVDDESKYFKSEEEFKDYLKKQIVRNR